METTNLTKKELIQNELKAISLILMDRDFQDVHSAHPYFSIYKLGVTKVEIDDQERKMVVTISCHKPGLLIGKGGRNISELSLYLSRLVEKDVVIVAQEAKIFE